MQEEPENMGAWGYLLRVSGLDLRVIARKVSASPATGFAKVHKMEQAEIVKKGDKVNVSAKIGALTVVTSGIALADGRRGEQIDVENKRSSRVIRTVVTGPSAVEVIL